MLRKLRPRSAYDVIALLALFLALTGGTAFALVAANQVNSASIINGEVKTLDIGKGQVTSGKVKDGTLAAPDVANGSLGGLKIADGSLTGADVANGSLTGADVNASTLSGIGTGAVFGGTVSTTSLTSTGSANGTIAYGPAASIGPTTTQIAADANATEAVTPPFATVARDLVVSFATGQVGFNGSTVKFSLRVGTTTTELSCDIVGAVQSCSDTSHAVPVPASSLVKIVIERTAGTGSTINLPKTYWTWRLLTP